MWLHRLSALCTVTLFGAVASNSFFHNPISGALAALPPQFFHLRTSTAVEEAPRTPAPLRVQPVEHVATPRNSSSAPSITGSSPVVRTYCHNVQRPCGEDCVDIPGDPYPCEKKVKVPKMCTRRVKRKTLCKGEKQCERKTYKQGTCQKTVKKRRKCPPKEVTYKCKKKVKVKKTCTKQVRSAACKKALNTKCKRGKKKKKYKCKKVVSAICTAWEDCLKVRRVRKPCKKKVLKKVEVKCDSKPVKLTPKKKKPKKSPAVLPRRTPSPKTASPTPAWDPPPKYKVKYGTTPGFTVAPWPSASSSPSPAVKAASPTPKARTPSASPSSSVKPSPSPSGSMPPFVNTYKTRSSSDPTPSASSSPVPAKPTKPTSLAEGESACACLNNGLDDSTEQCKKAPPSCKMMDDAFDTELCNNLCCGFCGKASEDRKEELELADFCSAHNEYVCSATDLSAGGRKINFNVRESLYALERALLGESDEMTAPEEEDEEKDPSIAEVERAGTKKCYKEKWVEENSMCEKTEQYKSRCPRMVGCKKKVDGTCTKVVRDIVNKPCRGHTGSVCKKRIPVRYDCSKTKTVKGKCKKRVKRKGKCKVPVVVKYPCKKAVIEKVPCRKGSFSLPNMKMCDKMVKEKYKCGSKTVKTMDTCYGPGSKDCRPKYCLTRVCDEGPPTY